MEKHTAFAQQRRHEVKNGADAEMREESGERERGG